MKYLSLIVLAFALVACNTPPSRLAYNSLATVGQTEAAAYTGYLDLVFHGTVRTNDVPSVTGKHLVFKLAFDAACDVAGSSTNITAAPQALLNAAAAVDAAIAAAKGN